MSLVFNTTLPFERIANVYAGPKEIKSNGSSSKSSSRIALPGNDLFKVAELSSPTRNRRKTRETRAELDPAFPLPSQVLR
jgi:hypothetical protein